MVRFIRSAWLPTVIILLAIITRYYDLTHMGHFDDMLYSNANWAKDIYNGGLFPIYLNTPYTNYPPVFMFILAFTSWLVPPFINYSMPIEFLILTKFFSVLAEIIIIGLVYRWIPNNTRLKWIVPLVLIIHPGLISATAFWGQADSIMALFLVLSILALNRNQPRMAWIWFAVAMLTKFQSVVLLPMLGILSLRRFGLRSTIIGIVLGFATFCIVYAPFVSASGFDNALRPFTGAVDQNAVLTANAFNLWFLITPSLWSLLPLDLRLVPTDTTLGLGGLTMKQIGFYLLAGYVFVIVIFMWRHYVEQREFVWATALYLAFFMLPTQIHERYLYPAAAFSVIAIVQDRRMWIIALTLMLSFTVNIVAVAAEHFYWMGIDLKVSLRGLEVPTALYSLICLILITWIVVWKNSKAKAVPTKTTQLQLETA